MKDKIRLPMSLPQNPKVFINYRIKDTAYEADFLYDLLRQYLPKEHIFMDIEGIGTGSDFEEKIETSLRQADIVFVLIGTHWEDEIVFRSEKNIDDWVVHEILFSLNVGKNIQPILFDRDILDSEKLKVINLHAFKKFPNLQAHHVKRKTRFDDMRALLHELGLKKLPIENRYLSPDEVSTLQRELKHHKAERAKLQADYATQRSNDNSAALRQELEEKNTLIQRQEEKLAKLTQLQQENQTLNQQLSEAQQLAGDNAQTLKQLQNTEQQLHQSQEREQSLHQQLQQAEAQSTDHAELQNRLSTTEAKLQSAQAREQEYKQQQEQLQREATQAKADSKNLNRKKEQQADRIKRLEEERDSLSRKLQETERETGLSQLRNENSTLKNQIDQLNRTLLREREELQQLKEKHQQALQSEQEGAALLNQQIIKLAKNQQEQQYIKQQYERENRELKQKQTELENKKTTPAYYKPVSLVLAILIVVAYFVGQNQHKPTDKQLIAQAERDTSKTTDKQIADAAQAIPQTEIKKKEPTPQEITIQQKKNFTETVNGVSFSMVHIKGGSFMMGSEDGRDYEKPVHQVSLSDYYLAETEVTQELYEAVMGSNPSGFKGKQLPVETVSWNDAQTFLKKLSKLTGKKYLLPTEAQWEYAAGGGAANRTKYAGTNSESELDEYAWYHANSGMKTHPIKTKKENPLGLYDMSGNVYEWCNDWHGNYKKADQHNPQGSQKGSNRVARGGSWLDDANFCRVAFRFSGNPGYPDYFLGFRAALVP